MTRFYSFCDLQRCEDKANVFLQAWIPTCFAIKDRVLKLRIHGRLVGGWKVLAVGKRKSHPGGQVFHEVSFDE